MNNQSLRRALTRRLVLVLAVLGVLAASAASYLGSRYANLAYDRALFEDVATLSNQIEIRDGKLHVDLPQAARAWLVADQGEQVRYRIVDLVNRRIVDANGSLGAWDGETLVVGQPYFRDVSLDRVDFRVAYLRHVVDPSDWPVLVEVGESRGQRDVMTRQIVGATLLLIGTMIAVAVWLVRQGFNSVLAPLRKLEAEAALRSSSNLTPLDPMLAPEEVRGLIGSINQMMKRLRQSIESQNRFIANAAHQLRTPIAGLQLQAQIALKGSTDETMTASIRDIEDSAARAAHLIEQLLVLSKAETDGVAATSQRVDLVEVAHRVIERFLPLAIKNKIDLGYDSISEEIVVAGNEVLLTELLSNLVDNGIRYGRPGGSLTVAVGRNAAGAALCVADNGAGISDTERKRMFERFYRPDSSLHGGAGLGLAIVKEIADRHFAEIVVEGEKDHGTRICVQFNRIRIERKGPVAETA